MSLRTFLLGSLAGTVLGWLVFGLIVAWLDPAQAGLFGFVLFFLALFLAVAATTALLGYGVRRLLTPRQLPAYSVRPALRQGLWLGVFLNFLLFLQLFRLARWWLTVIVAIFFLALEFMFLTYDRSARPARTTEEGS